MFCLVNEIETGQIANAVLISRQHVARVRYGRAGTTITMAKKIALGVSRAAGRRVPVAELFDLEFEVEF